MPNYPLPINEEERLRRLKTYGLLDTKSEEAYDRITRILTLSLGTPIALITLVDAHRQWFKSKVGLDIPETPRENAFCAHAICSDELMEIQDTTLDERFSANTMVLGDPNVRFYASVPLCVGNNIDGNTEKGFNVGALCTMDTKPRTLNDDERALLTDLAALVTDQMELRLLTTQAVKSENRLIDAVDAIPDGFVLYDEQDKLVMCNQRYKEIYSESADLLTPGTAFIDIIRKGVERGQYPDSSGNKEAWIAERMRQHHEGQAIEQQLPGDRWLRIEECVTREGGLVGFRVDITQLKRQQAELTRLAWTDSLTGALNRRRFVELVEAELNRANRSAQQTALILIDIDHFKQVNDLHGHVAGDKVLIEMVKRWQVELREYDYFARIGGEEFAVLLPQSEAKGALRVVERLLKKTEAEPVHVNGVDIFVTISAGLVLCMDETDTLDNSLARADEALYEAKKQGRNRFVSQIAHAA